MSYIAYINGYELEIENARDIAYNKQVNDIAKLDTRQSNFIHKFYCPPSAKNIRAMQNCSLVGNQSNIPYQKNVFNLIDAHSGIHLIHNGWAYVLTTNSKGYDVYSYDGIVDFYKTIENKNLSEIGIEDLNHIKDLVTIMASWNDTFAFKYIIADYNGKVYAASGRLNADYLIPSARRSYIWNRIHEYAGYTYSGSTFQTQKFLNYFLTFPKPVPTTEPIVTNISTQISQFSSGGTWTGGLGGYSPAPFRILFFPTPFSTTNANNTIANPNTINITTAGAYRLKIAGVLEVAYGTISSFGYYATDPAGSIIYSGSIDGSIGQSVILNLQIGSKIIIGGGSTFLWNGDLTSTLDLITGYTANFDEALVDFMCKDFINETMQIFGLTAFKDPNTNHIEYLTNEEIYQSTNIIDWSSKFNSKIQEKYIGGYAQKNNFKYRYNDENETHNDGAIFVNNENLKDEINVITSKTFSPEKRKTIVLTNESNVYKIWSKEVKDDGTIDYKELTGRYYSLRSEDFNWSSPQYIESELLGTTSTFTKAPIESFYRLKMQQIIFDNYKSIGAILDKYKIEDCDFDLDFLDVKNFDFKSLIYVEQLASYFQVNKIVNFVKGQKTTCELIEVDYFNELDIPDPIDYFLQINNEIPIVYEDCQVTITLFSDIPTGAVVEIIPYNLIPDGIGGFYYGGYHLSPLLTGIFTGSTFSFTPSILPYMPFGGWKFKLIYRPTLFEVVESNLSEMVMLADSCYLPVDPPTPTLSYLTITNIETISIDAFNGRTVRITYISDLTSGTMNLTATGTSLTGILPVSSSNNILASQNGTIDISFPNFSISGGVSVYALQLNALGVYSNIVNS